MNARPHWAMKRTQVRFGGHLFRFYTKSGFYDVVMSYE